jgi:hypothetical protein
MLSHMPRRVPTTRLSLTIRVGRCYLRSTVQAAPGKVIHVDFATRQREGGQAVRPRDVPSPPPTGRPLGSAREFVLLWRPPATRATAEYLGGRWDWGWTLFVWTSEAAVGAQWTRIVAGRGYVPQHLSREAFISFLHRASEIGGLLLDGELEGTGEVIRAEPEQLIGRDEAITALSG